jgi:hypothetical protein
MSEAVEKLPALLKHDSRPKASLTKLTYLAYIPKAFEDEVIK